MVHTASNRTMHEEESDSKRPKVDDGFLLKKSQPMNDETYQLHISKIIRTTGENPLKHDEFTTWIQAIQNAKECVELTATDDFRDDPTLIQIKRICTKDLLLSCADEELISQSNNAELDDGKLIQIKQEFESYLDVVRLPLPIPGSEDSLHQFLFICPDDYTLFFFINRTSWSILTGNPGVSKSWFQWKYIVFCYRPDLYNLLCPRDFIRQTKEYKLAQQAKGGTNKAIVPEVIVRTVNGEISYLFFVNRSMSEVFYFKHGATALQFFTTEKSTILWEPGTGTEEIEFHAIEAQIIATVSPNRNRFKGFYKNGAEMFYMPCLSEIQLRLMGQTYRNCTKTEEGQDQFPSDKEIQDRVREHGPFIRQVLLWDCEARQADLEERNSAIRRQLTEIRILISRGPLWFDETRGMVWGFSPRLARFVVNRDPLERNGGYGYLNYECSTDKVLYSIRQQIHKLNAKAWIECIKKYNSGDIYHDNFSRTCFEDLFAHYVTSGGLKWKYAELKVENAGGKIEAARMRESDWQDFLLQLPNKVVNVPPSCNDLQNDTLYFPSDPTFPFVDMVYKDDDGNLVGIQVTTSKKHPKSATSFAKFCQKLFIDPKVTRFKLYYVMLPTYYKNLCGQSLFPSFFWKHVKDDLPSSVQFYVILPPTTFHAKM